MAKKVVATLRDGSKDGRAYTKVIKMVKGACETLKTDYCMAVTGYAGPVAGDNDGVPVGTIWVACGTKEKTLTLKLNEDFGRDINLAIATNRALRLMLDFLEQEKGTTEE